MKTKYAPVKILITFLVIISMLSACTATGANTPETSQEQAADTETSSAASAETLIQMTEPVQDTVILSIECSNAAKAGMSGVPSDGVLLSLREVVMLEGDTVWDILSRVCDEEGIVLVKKGSGKSVLVTGISGLTPISAKSGWIYSVNGEIPMVGASAYAVKNGDVISWHYTMDSGKDLNSDGGL